MSWRVTVGWLYQSFQKKEAAMVVATVTLEEETIARMAMTRTAPLRGGKNVLCVEKITVAVWYANNDHADHHETAAVAVDQQHGVYSHVRYK